MYSSVACPSQLSPDVFKEDATHLWILVDYREKLWLKDLQTRLISTAACLVVVQPAALLVGDAEINLWLPGSQASSPQRWVWERKSLADLSSSIKDGRWSEQKRRILSAFAPSAVHYLIEDATPDALLASDPDDSFRVGLFTALQNASMRDEVHVHYAASGEAGRAQFRHWCGRMLARPDDFWRADSDGEAARGRHANGLVATSSTSGSRNGLHVKKSDNVSPALCYLQQLVQIPGISVRLARIVQAKYHTLRDLVAALQQAEEKKAGSEIRNNITDDFSNEGEEVAALDPEALENPKTKKKAVKRKPASPTPEEEAAAIRKTKVRLFSVLDGIGEKKASNIVTFLGF